MGWDGLYCDGILSPNSNDMSLLRDDEVCRTTAKLQRRCTPHLPSIHPSIHDSTVQNIHAAHHTELPTGTCSKRGQLQLAHRWLVHHCRLLQQQAPLQRAPVAASSADAPEGQSPALQQHCHQLQQQLLAVSEAAAASTAMRHWQPAAVAAPPPRWVVTSTTGQCHFPLRHQQQ